MSLIENLIPIPASEYADADDAYKELIRENNGIIVNDIYIDVWNDLCDILLLYGSYGSGKSVFLATLLIRLCLTLPYFKCLFGRKIRNKVRDSCFDTLIDVIEENGWQRFFRYSRKPNSTMSIICVNGNQFIPFGCDDASKIKSIKDPTHIWAEELDQFDLEDFTTLLSRLRTSKAKTQFFGSFNTEQVREDHWVKKMFFDPDNVPPLKVTAIKANFYHNFFIDQKAYYAKLSMGCAGNERLLDSIAFGEWGVSENKSPWMYAFDYMKHVSDNVPFLPTFPIYLAFDFNRDPVTCTLWQFSPSKGVTNSFIHCIDEFGGDMQLKELCIRIKTKYPYSIFFVTGDSSGNKGDVAYESKHDTSYTLIKVALGLSKAQMQPNSSNLLHENSRQLINAMFNSYPNLRISKNCKNLIRDCEIAEVDETGGKAHQLRKDREGFKMDYFDGMRYFFQKYFHDFAQNVYFRIGKRQSSGITKS